MNYIFSNVIIEVTRKCNMMCDHCMRGTPQNKNIKKEYIDLFFENVYSMSNFTISGGEPSMNINGINYIFNKMYDENISCESFFLATNGTNNSKEFLQSIMSFYLLTNDKSSFNIKISQDQFHEPQDYKFFQYKLGDKICYADVKRMSIIDEGNAKNITGKYIEKRSPNFAGAKYIEDNLEINEDDMYIFSDIYLNCDGYIVSDCDLSYKSQKKQEYILCHVTEFKKYLNELYKNKFLINICTND